MDYAWTRPGLSGDRLAGLCSTLLTMELVWENLDDAFSESRVQKIQRRGKFSPFCLAAPVQDSKCREWSPRNLDSSFTEGLSATA